MAAATVTKLKDRPTSSISEPTGAGNRDIELSLPYRVQVSLEGSADILLHRWNADAVEEKAKAAKGSAAKKSDNTESYVYRDDDGMICLPGEYLRASIVTSAKSSQDPRSARKSAMDLFKAGVVALTPLARMTTNAHPDGTKDWDYLDKRRVVVQSSGINRTRPAFKAGWRATFIMLVTTPEYIPPTFLNQVVSRAGLLVGLADFRPTYGRFAITAFNVLDDDGQLMGMGVKK